MKLDLNGTELTQRLDEALITRSLQALNSDDDSFLILSKDDMSYIQTCKTSDGHYMLEYQEGSLEKHYECADDMLNFQKVLMAFSSYLRGTTEWKTSLNWRLQDSAENATGAKPVKFLVMLGSVLLFAFTLVMLSKI